MYRHFCIMLTLLIALGYSVCISGCKPQSLVSTQEEVSIGREASQQVEAENVVVTDTGLNSLVNRLGQTLVGCSDRQDIQYTFKVLDTGEVNAFSLPGGWVYVDKGLITATAGKNDQLAGVIAHEIGHIVARHGAQQIGREIEANILIGALTRGQMQEVASIFADIELLHYSRTEEYEADRLGIKEMWRCSHEDPVTYNPEGLIDFFGYLLKIEGKPPSGFEQIFRTHPVTANRITAAQTYLNDLRSGKASP